MNIQALLSHPAVRAHIEAALAARGRGGDDHIVHVNDQEEAMLKANGGSGTVNPHTGLREFLQAGGNKGSDSDGSGGLGGGVGGAANSGSTTNGGGFGHASDNGNGSGAGAGGGHVGNNFLQFGTPSPIQFMQAPGAPAPPPPVVLPPAPPTNIPTKPLMSDTATTNLIGSRFGALPSWATTPYQVGTQPTSFPVEGQPFGAPPAAPAPPPPPPQGAGMGQGVGQFGSGMGDLGGNQSFGAGQGILANVMGQGGPTFNQGGGPITHQTPGFAALPQAWTVNQPQGPVNNTGYVKQANGQFIPSGSQSLAPNGYNASGYVKLPNGQFAPANSQAARNAATQTAAAKARTRSPSITTPAFALQPTRASGNR